MTNNMDQRFSGLEQSMNESIAHLERAVAVEDGTGRWTRDFSSFRAGMAGLIAVQAGIFSGETVDAQQLIDFRAGVVKLLRRNEDNLWSYLCHALDSVLASAEYGWYEPSMYRSVIQILMDEYPGGAAIFEDEDREYVDEMDEFMRVRGPLTEAISEEQIPRWVPESHWWWRHASWVPGE
ncbi:hypothetical protein [Nocardia tengchongensis]|uniref:hypothetical protein n=1 Tax=Nocardia tengchongensis TaxID=2055889 RepID=UPI00368DEA13